MKLSKKSLDDINNANLSWILQLGRFEKVHIHFKNGAALNKDGTWKHGVSKMPKTTQKWLQKNGWNLPKKPK